MPSAFIGNCPVQLKPITGYFGQQLIYIKSRHDICQKIYATAVLGARILRKKHVNRDISQFATKERKCFKMA